MQNVFLPALTMLAVAAMMTSLAGLERSTTEARGTEETITITYAIGLWGDLPYSDCKPRWECQPYRGHEFAGASLYRTRW